MVASGTELKRVGGDATGVQRHGGRREPGGAIREDREREAPAIDPLLAKRLAACRVREHRLHQDESDDASERGRCKARGI